MDIKYQKHKNRVSQSRELQKTALKLYNSGVSAVDVGKALGKTRAWVYWALKEVVKDKKYDQS